MVTDFLSSNEGRTTLNRAILPPPGLLAHALALRLLALSRPPQLREAENSLRAELQNFSVPGAEKGGFRGQDLQKSSARASSV